MHYRFFAFRNVLHHFIPSTVILMSGFAELAFCSVSGGVQIVLFHSDLCVRLEGVVS